MLRFPQRHLVHLSGRKLETSLPRFGNPSFRVIPHIDNGRPGVAVVPGAVDKGVDPVDALVARSAPVLMRTDVQVLADRVETMLGGNPSRQPPLRIVIDIERRRELLSRVQISNRADKFFRRLVRAVVRCSLSCPEASGLFD